MAYKLNNQRDCLFYVMRITSHHMPQTPFKSQPGCYDVPNSMLRLALVEGVAHSQSMVG